MAMTDIPGAIGRTTRVPRGLGHSGEQRESVTYCRVVNAVRVDVARHCRAHQTPRLAVLWTEVPTLEGLYRLGMKGREIADYFAQCWQHSAGSLRRSALRNSSHRGDRD